MNNKPERNPLKIIWLSRDDLLPKTLWYIYFFCIISLTLIKFFIPWHSIDINLKVYSTDQYIVLAVSALALILSMYTFGREVYTIEDFAKLYIIKNGITYYKYLANYLFPSLLWLSVLIFSILKSIIIVNFPDLLWDVFRVVYLSLLLLAILSTIFIVINNMSRVTNKVHITSEEIIKEKKEKQGK